MRQRLVAKGRAERGECVGEAGDGDEVFIQNPPVERDGDFPQEEDCKVCGDERADGGDGLGDRREETLREAGGLPVLCVAVGSGADGEGEEEGGEEALRLGITTTKNNALATVRPLGREREIGGGGFPTFVKTGGASKSLILPRDFSLSSNLIPSSGLPPLLLLGTSGSFLPNVAYRLRSNSSCWALLRNNCAIHCDVLIVVVVEEKEELLRRHVDSGDTSCCCNPSFGFRTCRRMGDEV